MPSLIPTALIVAALAILAYAVIASPEGCNGIAAAYGWCAENN